MTAPVRSEVSFPPLRSRYPTMRLTCRGNQGNLLQHWVLCELIGALVEEIGSKGRLLYVDAHAMAPYSRLDFRVDPSRQAFETVRDALPGELSRYEQAWHQLRPTRSPEAYPSSALFVEYLWPGLVEMVLCEIDRDRRRAIREWAEPGRVEVATDWRERFRHAIFSAAEVSLVSFDPYMYTRHPQSTGPGNMTADDLRHALERISRTTDKSVVQLSTYSISDNNPQVEVTAQVRAIAKRMGFKMGGVARVEDKMMSMVLTRNCHGVAAKTSDFEQRFETWLAAATAEPEN